ncbi:MAG: type II toxin-antitoxin system prevent-host-death family antitoxin [Caulobacterales bacterium]|jgi:prevent-host-death family protein|nr:type II toxin-antitoxin system prevent-host-death family antitoxin [Caulobacterales bacterium]
MVTWQLQTAKAKLSELLRAVREEGPQTISVRGHEEFVIMRKEDAPVKRPPKTWDELYAGVKGAGDRLLLPTREPESTRDLQLAEDLAGWDED